ncbi:MAG: AMP-binding protein, partial [Clostridia bacterium]|nr:AMP-binding protein [Clostridia bacterium]
MEYIIPKENYLRKPGNESCYEYLLMAYERISKDYGDDYTAFVTPVANVESEITMKRFIADIEKLASWFASKGIGKGDVVTAFLPTCGHAAVAFYALNKIGAISNFVHPLTPPAQLVEIMLHTKSKCLMLLDLFAGPFKPITDKFLTIVCSVSDFCDGIAYKYAKGNEMQNGQYEKTATTIPYLEIMGMDLPAVPTDTNP